MSNYDPIELARNNPVLAYAIYVMQMPLVPRLYTLPQIQYPNGVAGIALTTTFPQFFQNATIIKCAYVQATSNLWAGNIFRDQQQNQQELRLPFNCHIELTGGGAVVNKRAIIIDRRITDVPTPVNAIFAPMSSPTNVCMSALKNVVVNARQNIRLTTYSTRAITQAEQPFVLNFTFSVDEIDGCDLCACANQFNQSDLDRAVHNAVTTARP